MMDKGIRWVLGVAWLGAALPLGCRESTEPPSVQPQIESTASPASEGGALHANPDPSGKAESLAPAKRETSDSGVDQSDVLHLVGITMDVPDGWGKPTVQAGQFASKTIITLPKTAGDAADAEIQITHFPGMKGMDEQNIGRWVSLVTRDDGTPYTPETANVRVVELDHVRLKIIDLTGTVRTSMFGTGGGNPHQRLIAAIVDHPRGPHFVKAIGPEKTMARWAPSIDAFLRSATVE